MQIMSRQIVHREIGAAVLCSKLAIAYRIRQIEAAGFAYSILARALIRANGPDSAVAAAIGSDVKGYASLALYAAGIGLAFVRPWIAYSCYVAVAVLWFIPDRRFTRQ